MLSLLFTFFWLSAGALFAQPLKKITFAAPSSVGNIYVLQKNWCASDVGNHIDRQAAMFDACGTVNVPADRDLILIGNYYLGDHIDALRTVKPDDLAALDLSKLVIDDRAVAQVSRLTGLKRLHLEGSDVSDKSLCEIAKLSQLEYLSLAKTLVNGSTIGCLARLKHLRRLYLSHNTVDEAQFAAVETLKSLTALHVCGCGLSNKSMPALSKLEQLKDLNLSDNIKLDNRTLDFLCQMKSLRWLSLGKTSVSPSAFKKLQKLRLAELSFSMKNLTSNQIKELQSELPHTKFADTSKNSVDQSLFEPLH